MLAEWNARWTRRHRAGDGYDLEDVICKSGNQIDIKLDNDLNEVERQAE